MALLNNPIARAKVEALHLQILEVWHAERERMNEAGCDLCGSNRHVQIASYLESWPSPPKLCVNHRGSWSVSYMRNTTFLRNDLKFAKWLASMVQKESKKYAAQ